MLNDNNPKQNIKVWLDLRYIAALHRHFSEEPFYPDSPTTSTLIRNSLEYLCAELAHRQDQTLSDFLPSPDEALSYLQRNGFTRRPAPTPEELQA